LRTAIREAMVIALSGKAQTLKNKGGKLKPSQ